MGVVVIMAHMAIYMDGENLAELVRNLNEIPGATVLSPRPDMSGVFIVTDIVGTHSLEHRSGLFALVAIVSLRPATDEERQLTQRIMSSPAGEPEDAPKTEADRLVDLLGEVRE